MSAGALCRLEIAARPFELLRERAAPLQGVLLLLREGRGDLLELLLPHRALLALAKEADSLQPGDRVLMMGVGSGLNMTCLELTW